MKKSPDFLRNIRCLKIVRFDDLEWGTLNTNPAPTPPRCQLRALLLLGWPGRRLPGLKCLKWPIYKENTHRRSQTLRNPKDSQRGTWNMARAKINSVLSCLVLPEQWAFCWETCRLQTKLYKVEPFSYKVLQRKVVNISFWPHTAELMLTLTTRKPEKSYRYISYRWWSLLLHLSLTAFAFWCIRKHEQTSCLCSTFGFSTITETAGPWRKDWKYLYIHMQTKLWDSSLSSELHKAGLRLSQNVGYNGRA